MTKIITPKFKDEEEKNIVMATIGAAILLGLTGYLGLIAPIVVYFAMQNKLSYDSKDIIRRFSNFQITIFIICFILPFTVVGIPLIPIAIVYGLIISIIVLLAIMNNEPVKIPVLFEFIKESSITQVTAQSDQENPNDELKP